MPTIWGLEEGHHWDGQMNDAPAGHVVHLVHYGASPVQSSYKPD